MVERGDRAGLIAAIGTRGRDVEDGMRMAARAPGINVIGPLSSGIGLGAAARSTLRGLDSRLIAHVGVDLDPGAGAIVEELPPGTVRLPTLSPLPYGASVIHLNPDVFGELLKCRREMRYDPRATVNAIVPFWELPAFPQSWLPVLRCVDVILAPSRYVRDAAERTLPADARPLVWDYPLAVHPPAVRAVDRQRWLGDLAGCVTFLSNFDILSGIERKNPWGAIDAFQRAFAGRDDVALMIKVNHARTKGGEARFGELEKLAQADRRIRLMADPLSRDDLWSLNASVDCFVSLHRAEGLGLGLMEAMAVGKPVVATAWSGNMDFMDDGNSLLVPYRLVRVVADHPNYQRDLDQQWADPDVERAAEAMQQLADSPELRLRLGGEAQRSMQDRLHRQAERGALDELVELASSGGASTASHRAHIRAVGEFAPLRRPGAGDAWGGAKRVGVGALRRIGLKPPAPEGERAEGPMRILS